MTLAIKFRCYFADGASPWWIYCSAATYKVKRQIFDRFCDNYIMAPMLCMYEKIRNIYQMYNVSPACFAYWVILHAFLLSAFFFFKINFFEKILSGIPSECQTVGTQTRPDFLSFLQSWSADDISRQEFKFCLIWFFTSHQQSFS